MCWEGLEEGEERNKKNKKGDKGPIYTRVALFVVTMRKNCSRLLIRSRFSVVDADWSA